MSGGRFFKQLHKVISRGNKSKHNTAVQTPLQTDTTKEGSQQTAKERILALNSEKHHADNVSQQTALNHPSSITITQSYQNTELNNTVSPLGTLADQEFASLLIDERFGPTFLEMEISTIKKFRAEIVNKKPLPRIVIDRVVRFIRTSTNVIHSFERTLSDFESALSVHGKLYAELATEIHHLREECEHKNQYIVSVSLDDYCAFIEAEQYTLTQQQFHYLYTVIDDVKELAECLKNRQLPTYVESLRPQLLEYQALLIQYIFLLSKSAKSVYDYLMKIILAEHEGKDKNASHYFPTVERRLPPTMAQTNQSSTTTESIQRHEPLPEETALSED